MTATTDMAAPAGEQHTGFEGPFDHEQHDDTDSGTENGAAATNSDTTTDDASTGRAKPSRAQIRRAVAKGIEINSASGKKRELLSLILGTRNDVVDLAVAALGAPRGTGSAVRELFEIADADQMEAVMLGANLAEDRDKFKLAWSLLELLKVVSGGAPAQRTKAGLAIAKAAIALTPGQRSELDAALALLK